MLNAPVIGSPGSRRPHSWDDGPVPFPLEDCMLSVTEPDLEMVGKAVQCAFGELPTDRLAGVVVIATELVRNARQHGKRTVRVVEPPAPDVTLMLRWAVDQTASVRYAAVMVEDRNSNLPQTPSLMRSGLARVISLSHRCGAVRTGTGKQVWALVDTGAQ